MNGSHYEPAIVQGEARYQDARRVTLVEQWSSTLRCSKF